MAVKCHFSMIIVLCWCKNMDSMYMEITNKYNLFGFSACL